MVFILFLLLVYQGFGLLDEGLKNDFKVLESHEAFEAIHMAGNAITGIMYRIGYKTFNYGVGSYDGKLSEKSVKIYLSDDLEVTKLVNWYIIPKFCHWSISKDKSSLYVWDSTRYKTKVLSIEYTGADSKSVEPIIDELFQSICQSPRPHWIYRQFPYLLMRIDSLIATFRHLYFNNFSK